LGAADFLAGLGVRVPLLVDDPFVHLDEHRAGELWAVLTRISGGRQVILATQDRLVLDHLGIDPDLALEPSVAVPDPDAAEPAAPDEEPPADGPEPPDLWSHL
jgi:hypothetical protein